ncbi:hypothetical protein TIFTF001_032917 [Ficus carica]|uniref:Uncharacterized protein n=1 Tax=Ficus carica TaxID=3494 RepID=A0AA88DXY9_FICCA|nr:hypothetical protein TIFTF001_032917 [Ficus carica]
MAEDLAGEVDQAATNTCWRKIVFSQIWFVIFLGDLVSIGAILSAILAAIFARSSVVFGDLWLQLQRRRLLVGDLSVVISTGATSSATVPELCQRRERRDGWGILETFIKFKP